MGTRLPKRRIAALVGGGSALALLALVSVPAAGTAEPLVGAAGLASGGYGAAYLEIDGITPTSADGSTDHSKDELVRSMSWKISNATSVGSTTGGGGGRPTVGSFTVVKPLDGTTPQLIAAVARNTLIPAAHLFLVRQSGKGTQLEALEYDLRNIAVTSDEQATSADGSETLELVAQKVTVTYFSGTTAGQVVSIDAVSGKAD